MFKLPQIDFSHCTFLSSETIDFHFGKHHKAYIDYLNQQVNDMSVGSLLQVVNSCDGPLYNNAAQAWSHTFYWLGVTPGPQKLNPESSLYALVKKQYGGEQELKEKFISHASRLFGSGWCWLILNKETKSLDIINTQDANIPNLNLFDPLLCCDVWEHAYYIEYRNSRGNYLEDFWKAINWNFVQENFETGNLARIESFMK